MKDLLENKKQLLSIIGTLIISVIALLIVRFTYAYFAPIISEAFGNVIVDNGAVDELKFDPGDPLSFMVTEYTLPQNGGNLVKETHPKATLTSNSDNNTATYDYYIYFKIENNTFVYSDGSTPEIILTIIDYNGNEITSIEGLTYGTYDGVTGFDITTKNDIYEIAHPTINSTSSTNATTQEYTFKITYLNKSYDQLINIGNKMDVTVLMRKEIIPEYFANYIVSQFQSNTTNTNGLYHHDGTITSTSLGIDSNNTVLDAEDGSYRYSGPNSLVTNYVCFGYDDATHTYADNWCPADNIYRIIGVFDGRVKLIKNTIALSSLLGKDGDYYGSNYYFWNNKNRPASNKEVGCYHVWSYSALNIVNLNINYLNNIGINWAKKIDETTWYVNGGTWNEIGNTTVKNKYNIEFGETARTATGAFAPYTANVGLMYTSEYNYATYPNGWNIILGIYSNENILLSIIIGCLQERMNGQLLDIRRM